MVLLPSCKISYSFSGVNISPEVLTYTVDYFPNRAPLVQAQLSQQFTDALMDLVKSGAVSNSRKETYRGQSLVSYALGTKDLLQWLNQNPMVEFQGIDKVFDPAQIGRNPKFNAIIAARKIDLCGKLALQTGKGNIATGPAEVLDFFRGAEISEGGRIIFALPSRSPSR